MGTNRIVEWIKDPNTAFLLGAGCSVCAGKPLMDRLTKKVLTSVDDEKLTSLVENLQSPLGKPATIEDILNYLLGIQNLMLRRKDARFDGWDENSISTVIRKILKEIASAIGAIWSPSSVHSQYLQRIAQIWKAAGHGHCDIFSLNYDVVIEATFEAIMLPYTDGFRGADTAYFDPTAFDTELNGEVLFRLYKLHGSISWFRDTHGTARRAPPTTIDGDCRLMVYPCEQKFHDTRFGVYEVLLSQFRRRLRTARKNNHLVVIGYSFSDEHITDSIVDAINSPGSNLNVLALVGPEDDVELQALRFSEISNRCDKRFNALVGSHQFIGEALEPSEWESVKSLDLWRFENLAQALGAEE